MNRRGFLRLLGTATVAGVALPTLEKLDYLSRNPVSVNMPPGPVSIPFMNGDFEIDPVTKTIRYIGNRYWDSKPKRVYSVLDFHRALQDAFDSPELITEPIPSDRVTDQHIFISPSMKIGDGVIEHLNKGVIYHGDDLYTSVGVWDQKPDSAARERFFTNTSLVWPNREA